MSAIFTEAVSEIERCKAARAEMSKATQKVSNTVCWLYFAIGCLAGCTISLLLFGVVVFLITCNVAAPAKAGAVNDHARPRIEATVPGQFHIGTENKDYRYGKTFMSARPAGNVKSEGA